MKIAKLPHDPIALLDFFQEGLEALGAVCERSWHDRLQLVAEGRAAKIWERESDGQLIEAELHFLPPADSASRQADREVFPGCPLTFHLAEALRSSTLTLQRVCLQPSEPGKPPAPEIAEKLWHAQKPACSRWRQETIFTAHWHFSLLALIRCEIHAIDQHWSLHRVVLSLPHGQRDEGLATTLDFFPATASENIPWPLAEPGRWQDLLRSALTEELAGDLTSIRQRQERYLGRELERIDSYFETYEQELTTRHSRSANEQNRAKVEQRLAAAKTEHGRRRQDQIQRHDIRVIPHVDALVLLAEPAWKTRISISRRNETETSECLFVPRSRRWI